MKRPKRERLIIDNRSSRPLYEAYEQAFEFYFQEWCEEYDTQAMTWNGFVFYMRTNKDSITIQIYDDKNNQPYETTNFKIIIRNGSEEHLPSD